MASEMESLERWKSIARKATRRADRLELALENVEQHDPQLVEHALDWADKQMKGRAAALDELARLGQEFDAM